MIKLLASKHQPNSMWQALDSRNDRQIGKTSNTLQACMHFVAVHQCHLVLLLFDGLQVQQARWHVHARHVCDWSDWSCRETIEREQARKQQRGHVTCKR